MNVTTICTATPEWTDYHFKRFVELLRKFTPGAKLYTLVPGHKDSTPACHAVIQSLSDVVKYCTLPVISGRLIAYDLLRCYVPQAFGLQECLYIDVDCDVVGDLALMQPLLAADPNVDLFWVPSEVRSRDVVNHIGEVIPGFGNTSPIVEGGVIYFRKNCYPAMHATSVKYASTIAKATFVPGTLLWNLFIHTGAVSSRMLPLPYNQIAWNPLGLGGAKIIHHMTTIRHMRNQYDYARWPTELILAYPRVT